MAKENSKKARVLLDCAFGKVNDVVEVSDAELAAANKDSSHLDASPEAVAYAERIAAQKEADKNPAA